MAPETGTPKTKTSGRLWGGRFADQPDPVAWRFQASLPFDQRLYRQDIRASQAHARMLGRCGLLTPEEAQAIERGLQQVLEAIEAGLAAGNPPFVDSDEDIHTAVERMLVERIGDAGRKLHTARSRNDQVATDLRLYLRDEIDQIDGLLRGLQEALLFQAEQHVETVLPGYTHLQRAQPVVLAHHLLAYWEMFGRDRERIAAVRRQTNRCPLGAGALAGTTLPIDREWVARELGFEGLCANSLDAVSDRDFAVEFLAAAALTAVHLSRLGEELVLWSTAEFGFVEMDDRYSTGSSMMPQKKNPDIAELLRGKAGRVFGHLQGFLTTLKGLPLAYNKDLQEDKEPIFDTVDTLKGCLQVAAPMVASLRFRTGRMAEAARQGYLGATDLADYLVRKGVPFREAHGVAGRIVRAAIASGRELEEMPLEELQRFAPQIGPDVAEALDLGTVVGQRRSLGGTAPERVRQALEAARRRMAGA